MMTEGSLEEKTSDNMDRLKAEVGRIREEKKKENAGARKGGKVSKHCVF